MNKQPDTLTAKGDRNPWRGKLGALIGGVAMAGASMIGYDRLAHSDTPVSPDGSPAPTEVSIEATMTPEALLEGAGIQIVDKTPGPTANPTETITPSVTPTLEDGKEEVTVAEYPTIAPLDNEQVVPTSIVFSEIQPRQVEQQPTITPIETKTPVELPNELEQPTIAPVTQIENGPSQDSDNTDVIEPEATTPDIIEPEGVVESSELS